MGRSAKAPLLLHLQLGCRGAKGKWRKKSLSISSQGEEGKDRQEKEREARVREKRSLDLFRQLLVDSRSSFFFSGQVVFLLGEPQLSRVGEELSEHTSF